MRQRERDRETEYADSTFEKRERANHRHRGAAVRQNAEREAARTQAEHENCRHDRSGIERVAEDVGEHAPPYRLVDERADTGEKKQRVNHGRRQATAIRLSLTNIG